MCTILLEVDANDECPRDGDGSFETEAVLVNTFKPQAIHDFKIVTFQPRYSVRNITLYIKIKKGFVFFF